MTNEVLRVERTIHAPGAPEARESRPGHHLHRCVERGETLSAIARRWGVDEQQLLAANPHIVNAAALYPGDRLLVPPGHRGEQAQVVAAGPPAIGDVTTVAKSADIQVLNGYRAAADTRRLIDGLFHAGCGPQAGQARVETQAAPLHLSVTAAGESPTRQRIIDAAEAAGAKIVVLSDGAFAARYPGALAVTAGTTIFVKESVWENQRLLPSVLAHESMHVLFGTRPQILDSSRPMSERLREARELFRELGLGAKNAQRLLSHAGDLDTLGFALVPSHVQTAVNDVIFRRELAGLPPLRGKQLDRLYDLVTQRESLLEVNRYISRLNLEDMSRITAAAHLRTVLAFLESGPLDTLIGGLLKDARDNLNVVMAICAYTLPGVTSKIDALVRSSGG